MESISLNFTGIRQTSVTSSTCNYFLKTKLLKLYSV